MYANTTVCQNVVEHSIVQRVVHEHGLAFGTFISSVPVGEEPWATWVTTLPESLNS